MSNEEKILAILEEHSKQFEQINKRFDEQEARFNSRFYEQEARFDKIDEKLESHGEDIKTMKASIININNTLEVHSEDIKTMKASIINLEEYVMEKIPTLFDAITVNSNKHDTYDDHIASLNAKTFNHNIRISALEDTLRPLPA